VKNISFAKLGLAALFFGLTMGDSQAQPINSADVDAFQVADQAGTREAYNGYLDAFPTGVFSVVARERARPALLTDLLPRMAPEKPKRGKAAQEELDQVWQEAWDRVKASDTEAGYLEYLTVRVPSKLKRPGEDLAFARYLELTEQTVSSISTPVSCTVPEADPKVITPFKFERSVPDEAIKNFASGIIRGHHIVSPTGQPLGYATSFASSPYFLDSNKTLAMQMAFSPARRKCVNTAARFSFGPNYILGEDSDGTITDSRPMEQASLGLIEANGRVYTISLLADQALFVDLPPVPSDRERVWRLRTSADFPLLINVLDHEGQPKNLWIDGYIPAPTGCPGLRVRFSAPDNPDPYYKLYGRPPKGGPPISGKFKIVLTTAYDGPAIPKLGNPRPICSAEKPS